VAGGGLTGLVVPQPPRRVGRPCPWIRDALLSLVPSLDCGHAPLRPGDIEMNVARRSSHPAAIPARGATPVGVLARSVTTGHGSQEWGRPPHGHRVRSRHRPGERPPSRGQWIPGDGGASTRGWLEGLWGANPACGHRASPGLSPPLRVAEPCANTTGAEALTGPELPVDRHPPPGPPRSVPWASMAKQKKARVYPATDKVGDGEGFGIARAGEELSEAVREFDRRAASWSTPSSLRPTVSA